MANYRPKSLDELNNLYGKSLNAQQEIVKKASVLEEKTQSKDTAPSSEEKTAEYKIREQEANDQISGYVNDFIRSFGTPVKPDRSATATVTASMKTVPVGKAAEARKESEAVKAAAENQSEDKPRLIRNSERNSLFENYKKVMDDEDDYDFSDEEKTEKKKPKKLFDKKSSKPAEEENKEEAAEESKAETETAPEAKKEAEPVKPVAEKKPEAIAETEVEVKEEDEQEKAEKKKGKKEKKQKAPKEKKQKPAKASKESKGTVSRAFVMLLIFCVLLCATAVGGVKAFSGINTDSLVMEKYRIYTADRAYSRLDINEGDLVIVEHRGIDYNDVFAYEKNSEEFAFARLTTVLNDESVIADDGDLRCLVFNDSVRGVVYKTIPAVGAVASLIMSDFLMVLGVLLALAFILMLIAIFGCKPKAKKAKKEKAKKEKVKKEKKSKKNKQADEDIAVQAAENAEETDTYDTYEDDDSDFAAIEADFSFLLNSFDDEPGEAEEYTEAQETAEVNTEAPVEEAFTEASAEKEAPAEEVLPESSVKYEISADTDEESSE